MPKKKRKFIDKKNAITFNLMHRSQHDPLVTDETAPQMVLAEVKPKKRKDEREKYGIYFDDDYDYLQHLRPLSGRGEVVMVAEEPAPKKEKKNKGIELPSSVFQSHVEEKVGVLNKAAPKTGLDLSLDPEIVAAMDDDFDFSDPENMLEDNFMELANGVSSANEGEEGDFGSDFMDSDEGSQDEDDEDDDEDEVGSLEKFETKSRFTQYSMTSSVIRRNEQLTRLDDKFEGVFGEYDDNEIGALECEDIEGNLDPQSDVLMEVAEKYEKSRKVDPLDKEKILIPSESESSDSEYDLVPVEEKERWDCESILSTYSTAYNHPKTIDAPPAKIRINPKTGIPETKTKLTKGALARLDDPPKKATGPGSLVSVVSTLSIRPKNEAPGERKERKKAFREYKSERRVERKINKEAFKEEKKRMEKMMAHNKSNFTVQL